VGEALLDGLAVLLSLGLHAVPEAIHPVHQSSQFVGFLAHLVVDEVIADDLLAHQLLHAFQVVHYLLLHLLLPQTTAHPRLALLQPPPVLPHFPLQQLDALGLRCPSSFLPDARHYLLA
jgi:cobalamin biosynthesis protein CobD/CbiB